MWRIIRSVSAVPIQLELLRPLGDQTRSLTNSALSAAAAKGKSAAKKPQAKKKTVLRKNAPSGPRSSGTRRKAESSGQSTSALSKSSPFFRDRPEESVHADPLDLAHLDELHVGQLLRLPEGFVKAAATSELAGMRGSRARTTPSNSIVLRSAQRTALGVLRDRLQSTSEDGRQALLLTGRGGSGKTVTSRTLAAAAHGAGAVVIMVPHALALIDSTSAYIYSADLGAYLQPALLTAFIRDLLQSNRATLSRIPGPGRAQGEAKETIATALEAALAGTVSVSQRQRVLEDCLRVLAAQKDTPTVLVIDEAEALFSEALYRDADFRLLQSHDLALVRLLLNIVLATANAGGHEAGTLGWPVDKALALNRGLVVCATTESEPRFADARQRLNRPHAATQLDYGTASRFDKQHRAHVSAGNFRPLPCDEPLTLSEAARLFELTRRGSASSVQTDEDFLSKVMEGASTPRAFLSGVTRSLL